MTRADLYRAQLLKRHMAAQGLTTHALATALSVPMLSVRASLEGWYWFLPATERRLTQFLEVERDEFLPLA